MKNLREEEKIQSRIAIVRSSWSSILPNKNNGFVLKAMYTKLALTCKEERTKLRRSGTNCMGRSRRFFNPFFIFNFSVSSLIFGYVIIISFTLFREILVRDGGEVLGTAIWTQAKHISSGSSISCSII